ncbi:MAG TPA: sugar ABC transporter permease [Propionibacteriaceae bacterium]|jgi:multiple sugar transport system permease protein|nr:sugar ABC transporter permease [Propionibacteriaceae bacterium]
MSTTSPTPTPARPARTRTAEGPATKGRRRRKMSVGDKIVVGLMVTVPTLLVVLLIWLPALSSVLLGFTRWEGIGGLDTIQWIGLTNYKNIFTIYPPFWPALQHNLLFLIFLFLVSAFGMFLAVLLDKEIRGSRFYQTAYYLPVVLSLALTGFIWQLLYSRDQGLINAVTGLTIDWYGDPKYNLWAVMVATGWQHAGYIMLLYLAGLKSVDPALREAAAVDGASQSATFFRVILPVLRPINLIVLVVTMITSLRLFDLVWVINKGRNGLELIAALVTQNIIGEASRIGFGSALATIMLLISSVFVVIYLNVVFREAKQ